MERKKGLVVEWGERGIERRPLTAEGLNAEPPLPCWGFVLGCKGDERGNTRDRQLPLFFKALVKTEVMTGLDEDVKNSD